MTTDIDGRTIRARRAKSAVLRATKDLLKGGVFQPTAKQIATAAGVCVRTVFQHYNNRDALLIAAIEDGKVREQIANFVCCIGGPPLAMEDQLSMVKAIVLGRVL